MAAAASAAAAGAASDEIASDETAVAGVPTTAPSEAGAALGTPATRGGSDGWTTAATDSSLAMTKLLASPLPLGDPAGASGSSAVASAWLSMSCR